MACTALCHVVSSCGLSKQQQPFRGRHPRPVLLRPAVRRVVRRPLRAENEGRTSGEIEEGFNPWEILRISRGTSFLGLQNAKQLAEEKAAGDSEQLAKIERAYNFFIDASRERFEAAVEQNPGSADAAFQLANFCQSVDDTARAEKWYAKALELDPGHVDALNNVGSMRMAQGDLEGAEEAFKRANDAAPEDVDVLFNWACARLSVQDLKGTKELVDKIVELRPELKDHPLVAELASP